MAIGESGTSCTVVLHDDSVSKEDVLCGANVLPSGSIAYLVAPGATALCIHPQTAAKNADEVSLHITVAKRFGFENRMTANVSPVQAIEEATAGHVELSFRDQHLSRADMWRMKAQVDGFVLYQGQKLHYLGSTAASVEAMYIAGRQVDSAYVSQPETKLIFRSGSARFTILIQVSKEMLQDWVDGYLMYERLIAGFLPELFQRWDDLKVRHTVTVIIFGRRLMPPVVPLSNVQELPKPEDFLHIIASDMPSSDWRDLVRSLKRAFNSITLPKQVCLAARGNMLEAINIAAMDFADPNIDPHLSSTGTSIMAITAGGGLFETHHELLRRTTKLLMGISVGVDIISMSPKPLHPAPLFQYWQKERWEYALPHWVDISYWHPHNKPSRTLWLLPDAPADVSDVAIPALERPREKQTPIADLLNAYDEDAFGPATPVEISLKAAAQDQLPANVERLRQTTSLVSIKGTKRDGSSVAQAAVEDTTSSKKAKREHQPPHALMQAGRNISLGPRGLALSQGVASATVSAHHAQHDKDATETGPARGLANQIRATLRRKPSQHSLTSKAQSESLLLSNPIDIQDGTEHKVESHRDPASLIEEAVMKQPTQDGRESGNSLSASSRNEYGSLANGNENAIGDKNDIISPWLTLLNPCNPRRDNMRVASEYRQWQNVFPRAVSSGAFKWDSICTPAVLPLMTEHRVSLASLDINFNKKVRRLLATQKGARKAMLNMIALRLIAGFQIVPMRRLPHEQTPSEHIERMLLSLGGRYHELRCLSDVEVQVSEYESVYEVNESSDTERSAALEYCIALRGVTSRKERPVKFLPRQCESSTRWSPLDDHSVNTNAVGDTRGMSQTRFVLIPAEVPRTGAQMQSQARELSDEERRIDGIQRLTQIWQRNRYFADADERHTASMNKTKTSNVSDRDFNPLAIEYQTRDPSAVVSTYGTALSGPLPSGDTSVPLFAESEMYHSSNFDMMKLVKQMQELPPIGVEVRDRRWFTRLHLKCFRGDEMTNWLLRVFKDLQTRHDAVSLGNDLMDKGIFTHVRGKHEFRDGNYFYQIKSAHRTTDYPDTAGFFTKAVGRSVPSTPISEFKHSPTVRFAQGDTDLSSQGAPTPTLAPVDGKEKTELLLSQVLQYNVDPAKKSGQLEIVNLHYDRIHNPDNCYHIQLDWTSTTPRLIRESVTRWASLVESHGLRLVQLPLAEASKICDHHPLDQPISVRIAIRPPERVPATPHLEPQAFSPRRTEDPDGYHKALLRKLDFVLDLEAASSFPPRIDVSYSWGRPSYEFTQFVHKSGLLLAQIPNHAESDFLLLRNRVAPQLNAGPVKKTDTTSLENLVRTVVRFCRDEVALRAFFQEFDKPKLSAISPLSNAAMFADISDVPPMELPPHLLQRTRERAEMTQGLQPHDG